jgi:O-acetyl-ADP-ribose deacetylase (regulator of RNase III)
LLPAVCKLQIAQVNFNEVTPASQIKVIQGDITRLQVDAIVNAANSSLMGGGGVDGAIHRAGGPAILDACRIIVARQGGCETGEAVITTAGKLPSRFVIHTVGPVWSGGHRDEAALLARCYKHSLQLAMENDCRSIAFPNISTGIYGFPKKLAAQIAVTTTHHFMMENGLVEEVIFACFDHENFILTTAEMQKVHSP